MSSPASSSARPILQQLYATLDQLLRQAHAKLPSWTSAAALAFVAGFAGALLWTHSSRRRWRAASISTERTVPLLKRVCASCWDEQDVERSGWLEPFEARIALARILDSLQEHNTLLQLAALLAPHIESPVAATIDSSTSSTTTTTLSALPTAHPLQVEIEQELRAHLLKLLQDLRRPASLEAEFAVFLEHIEARPSQLPHSFTPPVGQSKKASRQHSPRTQSNAHTTSSIASTVSSTSDEEIKTDTGSSSSAAAPAPMPPSFSQSAVDRKVFRFEFNTAVVLWLQSQIRVSLYKSEQSGFQS